MAEALTIPKASTKEEVYQAIIPQIAAVVDGVDDIVANMANIAAILKQAFDFHWVGFYRVTSPEKLVLGPFQGPLACVTIPFSKGVCGAARGKKTLIVEDVDAFPGHIACSSLSKSEIVVPLVHNGETRLVLDVDSDKASDFDDTDRLYLEQVIGILQKLHFAGVK